MEDASKNQAESLQSRDPQPREILEAFANGRNPTEILDDYQQELNIEHHDTAKSMQHALGLDDADMLQLSQYREGQIPNETLNIELLKSIACKEIPSGNEVAPPRKLNREAIETLQSMYKAGHSPIEILDHILLKRLIWPIDLQNLKLAMIDAFALHPPQAAIATYYVCREEEPAVLAESLMREIERERSQWDREYHNKARPGVSGEEIQQVQNAYRESGAQAAIQEIVSLNPKLHEIREHLEDVFMIAFNLPPKSAALAGAIQRDQPATKDIGSYSDIPKLEAEIESQRGVWETQTPAIRKPHLNERERRMMRALFDEGASVTDLIQTMANENIVNPDHPVLIARALSDTFYLKHSDAIRAAYVLKHSNESDRNQIEKLTEKKIRDLRFRWHV